MAKKRQQAADPAGFASLGGVPIEYVGKKPVKVDNVAGTGLEWTPGQVHIVPPLVAQKLLHYPDVWRAADPDAVAEDPSHVGMVVDEGDVTPPAVVPPIEQQTFDLPNLQGMTAADLQTFAASQFNFQLDAAMEKDAMINQIVTLANSRATDPGANE